MRRRLLILPAALAIAWSCRVAVPRKPDAPRPTPAIAKVNLALIALGGQRDITRSPKLGTATLGKVVLSFPTGAFNAGRHSAFAGPSVGMDRRANIQRLVRKALLSQRLEVVAGEIHALAETSRALAGKRGQLTEAEELVLLGKETGADAVLVFDQLGTSGFLHDVRIDWNEAGRMFVATPAPAGGAMPACPGGFRMKVPAFFARGRLISTADSTILAEFNVKLSLFDQTSELAAPVDLIRYFPEARRVRDTYQSNDGCDTEYHEYEYVASWDAIDVLCAEVQKRIAPHLLPVSGGWDRVEPSVEAAVNDLVAGVFSK